MILHPAIIALLVGSLLVSGMLVYAALYGVQILRNWDIKSGSELQLSLERRTYLISTLMSYAFGFQLISFFLFIYTADKLCHLFVGAMCAVGTLSVSPYGYPALLLKLVNFLLAGLWLIVNFTDNNGSEYPLIKMKYRFLLVITPFVVAETVVQGKYFLSLKANVITSCCGSFFSATTEGMASEIAAFPHLPMVIVFYLCMGATLATGVYFYLRGKGAYLFALTSAITFPVSIAALISFISLYYYELPTHHCPFCILQKEYHFVGYPLYIAILVAGVTGLGVGMLLPFRSVVSLQGIIPRLTKRLTLAALIAIGVSTAVATWPILFSSFSLRG